MTVASVRHPRFAPGVPQRELRLVVEGVSSWCAGLTEKRGCWRSCGFIQGPPGAGQTEILESLGSVCRELGVGVFSVRSVRGARTGPRLTAELARQLLVAAYGLAENGSGGSVLPSQLEQELLRLTGGLSGEETAESLPILEPAYQRMRLVDSIARSLLELAARRPLILTVENLGNVEELLLEVLRHFLRLAARRRSSPRAPRLLLIATLEQAEDIRLLEDFQTEQEDLASLTAFSVQLRGYSRAELCESATRVLGEPAPTSTREKIMRATQGNPRHIRWLLADAKETGDLDLRPRRLTFAQIVTRRFGRLSERQQEWLVLFAFLRRPVRSRLLEAVAGSLDFLSLSATVEGDGIAAELAELESASWLRTSVSKTDEEPAWFSICDGDVADLILESLGAETLRLWRLHLGRSLAEVSGGQCVDLSLAACDLLLHAGELDEATIIATEAADTLRSVSCFPEALELIESVLSESRGLALSAFHGLREQRVTLLHAGGYFREALEVCEALLNCRPDAETVYRMGVLRAELYGRLGEHDQQVRVVQEAIERFSADSSPVRRANLFAELGHACRLSGAGARSLGTLEECLSVLPEGSFDHAQVRRVFELAVYLHADRGQLERSLEVARDLARTRCPADRFQQKVNMFRRVAELELRLGRLAEAETALHEGLSHANRSGSRWLVAEQLEALGRHWAECRNPSAALAYLEQAYGIYVDLGKAVEAASLRFRLLALELELGFFDRARKSALAFGLRAEYREGVALADAPLEPRSRRKALRRFAKLTRARNRGFSAEDSLHWGRVLEDDGRIGEAFSLYREGLRSAQAPETRLDLYRAMGDIALLQGDAEAGLRFVEKGLSGVREGLDRARVASAAVGVAEIYQRRGDLPRACDAAVRALRLVQEEPVGSVVVPAFLCFADVLMECGAWKAARDLALSAAYVAQSVRDVRGELEAGLRLCAVFRELGDVEASTDAMTRVDRLSAGLDLPVLRTRLLLEKAWSCRALGKFEEAREAALLASNSARALRTPTLLTRSILAIGSIQGAPTNPRKNFLSALDVLEQGIARAENEGCPRLRWELLLVLAALHADRGSVDVAETYRRRAADVFQDALGAAADKLPGWTWVPYGGVPSHYTREPEPTI
jgi:tetratricopeptide (TPR) repeat protein